MLAPGSEWHPLGRERCGLQTDTALSGKRMETDGETPDSQPVQGFCAFRGRALLGRGETDMEPSSPRDFPASCGRFSRPQVGGADRDRVGADRASMRYRSRRPADTTLQESAGHGIPCTTRWSTAGASGSLPWWTTARAGMSGAGRRHLDLRPQSGARARPDRCGPRQAGGNRLGQWYRADVQRDAALGRQRRVAWHYIARGKPTQNAFERFNGRLSDKLLNEMLFRSLPHAGVALDA